MRNEYASGSTVRVKAYGGQILERKVVADLGKSVVVCTEQEFVASKAEGRKADGVGFPKSDVTLTTSGL